MTKVLTVVGTRPEVIRLSRVCARLDSTVEHVVVHTGQSWDHSLSGIFFEEMGIRRPDHYLDVDTSSLGRVLGGVLTGIEATLERERPDAMLVLGDTNSCIAAVMARRMRVPIYHMEAGNRCFDLNVPEETNRRLVDHVADFNLVYTEHARRNLLAEGIHPQRILLTGSPMREVLDHHRLDIERSEVLTRLALDEGQFFVVSAHREETVDHPERLRDLVGCLRAVRERWEMPVLVSTHPRTRKRLSESGYKLDADPGIAFHEPFGFLDYVRMQQAARCVLSDSGTVSEEACILGFAAVTLRNAIERPESLDTGSVVMTGLEPAGVLEAVEVVVQQREQRGVPCPADYMIEDTSRRVVNFILSTVRRHHEWAGIRRRDSGSRT